MKMEVKNYFVLSMIATLLCSLGSHAVMAMDGRKNGPTTYGESMPKKGVGGLDWNSLPHVDLDDDVVDGYDGDNDDDLLCSSEKSSVQIKKKRKTKFPDVGVARKQRENSNVKGKKYSFAVLCPEREQEQDLRNKVPYMLELEYHFVRAIPIFPGINGERHFEGKKISAIYALEKPRGNCLGVTHLYIQLLKNPGVKSVSTEDYVETVRNLLLEV